MEYKGAYGASVEEFNEEEEKVLGGLMREKRKYQGV